LKKLIVTRHAKSSWNSDVDRDFLRPLNKRGEHDAPMMAERLLQRGPLPELILSSTATRALSTANLLITNMSLSAELLLTTDSIYEAPLTALQKATESLTDDVTCAMLVGHNPGVSNLCNYLCLQARIEMPTCAMACFDLDIDSWNDVYKDCASLAWYDYPKNL